MLEPTHLCNLACSGCGRIREYADTIQEMMSLDECLKSVDECPSPVVTITGGEPFLYPHVYDLIGSVLDRGKHIYFCTNGVLLEKALDNMRPHPNFTLNVHMDGLEETHDRILERKGAFKMAMEGIKKAKKLGFRVCTNTTIFKETNLMEIEMLFTHLEELGVDGLLVAPGFGYEAVGEKLFLERREIEKKFAEVYEMSKKHRFYSTPMYLRVPQRGKEAGVHPLGQSHPQPAGMEGALLPHYRHPLSELQGDDGKDRLGQIRGRQGHPLRPMHDALRFRAHGCTRDRQELEGYCGDDDLEFDVI